MTAMINYYRANTDLLDRYPGAPPVIETPTLIVWGEEDTALGIELTRGYEPFVRDLTLQTLPNVSHWVQQEAAGEVNRRLGEWMALKHLTA